MAIIRTALIIFFAFLSLRLAAQIVERPIAIDPAIGDTVRAVTRAELALLPDLRDFEKAVFFLNPDSTLRAQVFTTHGDTVLPRYHTLAWLRTRVAVVRKLQHAEEAPAPGVASGDPVPEQYGRRLSVSMTDGGEFRGTLLAVRDTALVLSLASRFDTEHPARNAVAIRIPAIRSVHFLDGTGAGGFLSGVFLVVYTLSGIVMGAFFGSLTEDIANPMRTVVSTALFLTGIAGAVVIGANMMRSSEVEFLPASMNGFKRLRSNAMYPFGEPPPLRDVH